ncbi:MAG: ErfK/YbiS/YcfS/YnhG family protein, partial [uncultured Actinomycetospora sp.]
GSGVVRAAGRAAGAAGGLRVRPGRPGGPAGAGPGAGRGGARRRCQRRGPPRGGGGDDRGHVHRRHAHGVPGRRGGGHALARPQALDAERPARLRRHLHLEWHGHRARRWLLAADRVVHHGGAGRDGARDAEHRRRPRGRGGRPDHAAVRGAGGGQGGRRAGAAGAHVGAHRGVVGLAARPGRRVAGALAAQGVLALRHPGRRRGEPARRAVRRGRVGPRGPHHLVPHRARPDRARRRQQLPHGGRARRPAGDGRAGQLRHRLRPRPHHALGHPRGHREVPEQADGQPAVRLRRRHGLCGADLQQRGVHPRQPRLGRIPGVQQRHTRLRQPLPGRRPHVLRLRALRRSRRGHRVRGRLLGPRRRHLRLGRPVGPVAGDVRVDL